MTTTREPVAELTTCYAQVLTPIDFSPLSWRVLTLSRRMAKTFGAPLRLLHVDTTSLWQDQGSHKVVLKAAPDGRSVNVEVVAARSATAGVIRTLGDDESSLLVMSAHGHTGPAELAMGSTTVGVLREWEGPVLLAGPHFIPANRPFRRIVLCVDPSAAPAPRLLADVAAWAGRFDARVELLTVDDQSLTKDLDEVLESNQRLEGAAEFLGSRVADVEIVRRYPDHAPTHDIVSYADSKPGTLVAMATHARPAAVRSVLGSTTLAVVRRVACPVLVRRTVHAARVPTARDVRTG